MRLPRRERPSAEVVRLLDPGERVTGWADLAGGGVAVATPLGVWLPGAAGPCDGPSPAYERIPWYLIDKATWNPPRVALTVAVEGETLEGASVLVELPPRTLSLATARNLPMQVRDRVTRSVRHSAHHALAPGGGVWVVARRVAGRDGLTWQLRFDPGTDPGDPILREQVTSLLAGTRQALTPVV
jgi:hypothetical protein